MTSFASAQLPVRMLSLFAVAAAAGLSLGALAQEKATPVAPAAPASTFSFNGYWRTSFNTAANPTLEASDTQGTTAAPFTRHIAAANFWNLNLSKSVEAGPSFNFKFDGAYPAKLAHASVAGENADIRLRDMYVAMPMGDGMTLWSGARELETGRERLMDIASPFNHDGFGLGLDAGAAKVALSMKKASQVLPVVAPATSGASFATKDITILGSYEVPVSDTLKVRPILMLTMHGGVAENTATATKAKAVKGSTEFKVGAIINHGTGFINNGQATVWFHSAPSDKTGETSGSNSTVGVLHSSAWDLGMAGVLTGFSLQSMSYKDKLPVLKVDDGKIVADGTNTTTSTMKVSIGAQPVYYVTDHFHAALDFNYALTTKKVSAADANLLALTPILRYALAKNPVGTPQIYTSLTYGKYDAKVKKATNGEATDTLITTQTGMEVWF